MPRRLHTNWPLIAALASLAMLAAAHAFESFGHLAPCELCLKQRTVYWAAAALGLAGYGLGKALKAPLVLRVCSLLLGLVFLAGAGLAAYHAGVEWKFWPGPTSCTGSASVSAQALDDLLNGAKVARPACDVAAWRMLGISMAGYNALISLGLAAVSVWAGSKRRGL